MPLENFTHLKNLLFTIVLFFGLAAQAQLVIDESLTVSQLVQNVLVDASVQPSNILFNGQPGNQVKMQVSRFYTGDVETNLGLNQGLILATTDAKLAKGPNNKDDASTIAFGGTNLDADLMLIPGAQFLESSSVLEFDFVATGSELNFDFIFASEEYPEYANSSYNDVFGFFLSGPGITGPYSNNAKNIALIPDTTTEITINNLNNGTQNMGPCEYCEFYINNGIGNTPGLNPHIQYDGFTTVIRAKSVLVCGQTYHMKLAIGNVGDNTYDSAVFIKNFNVQQSLELVESNNLTENMNVCFGEDISIFSGIDPQDNVFVWTKDGAVIAGNGPSITVSEAGNYALSAYNTDGCRFAFDEILIGYRPEMAIVDPPDINLCALLAPTYTFPTINQTSVILGALNPSDYLVSYYDSSYLDAFSGSTNGLIPLANLDNYTITTATGVIWARVQEVGPTLYGCVKVISFNINAYGIQTGDISYAKNIYCTDTVALQPVMSTASLGGVFISTPSGLELDSLTGAISPSQSLGGSYTVTYNVPATGSCPAYSTPPAFVTINSTLANEPLVVSPVLYCKDAPVQPLMANGIDLLWYQTATGGVGSATAPIPNTAVIGSTTYYVSQTIGDCESDRASITVMVSSIPNPPTVNSVNYCLNETALPLTANGTDLIWYDSSIATIGSSIAPVPDTSVSGNKTFYVSQLVNGCESQRAILTVQVKPASTKPQVGGPIVYCLNDSPSPLSAIGNNLMWYEAATGGAGTTQAPTPDTSAAGIFYFYVTQNSNGCESDREVVVVEVISTLITPVVNSPIQYCQNEMAFPLTANGANLNWYTVMTGGIGSTIAPTPQTSTPGVMTYYVSQNQNGCESPRVPIVVEILSPASFTLPQDGILCTNNTSTVLRSFVLDTQLDPTLHSFDWYDLNSGVNELIPGAIDSFIEVQEPGSYGVKVTDLITGCISEMITAEVSPVFPPSDFTYTASSYFVDPATLSIDVVPTGDYWYRIDGQSFQEESYFSNLAFGPHTVTVMDVHQCASLTKELFFVNYPKFFTPNGDSYNDTWNINDLDRQHKARIHIFDKFGKLIKVIFPSGEGWDGTYNQEKMPSADYWFVIYYDENNQSKQYRSHFSLKR